MKQTFSNLYTKIQPQMHQLALICSNVFSVCKKQFLNKKASIIKVFIPIAIIAGGYVACSHSQRLIIKNIQSVFDLSEAIRLHYADKPNYWGLNTDYVIKNNIAPSHIIKDNKLILDGNTQIFVGSGSNADTVMPLMQSYDIVIHHLNKAQCMSYAESVLSEEQRITLLGLSIINDSGTYTFEWGGKYSLPIQKYATKKLCTDKENTIIWSLK